MNSFGNLNVAYKYSSAILTVVLDFDWLSSATIQTVTDTVCDKQKGILIVFNYAEVDSGNVHKIVEWDISLTKYFKAEEEFDFVEIQFDTTSLTASSKKPNPRVIVRTMIPN